jgi:hypothetical protein
MADGGERHPLMPEDLGSLRIDSSSSRSTGRSTQSR